MVGSNFFFFFLNPNTVKKLSRIISNIFSMHLQKQVLSCPIVCAFNFVSRSITTSDRDNGNIAIKQMGLYFIDMKLSVRARVV